MYGGQCNRSWIVSCWPSSPFLISCLDLKTCCSYSHHCFLLYYTWNLACILSWRYEEGHVIEQTVINILNITHCLTSLERTIWHFTWRLCVFCWCQQEKIWLTGKTGRRKSCSTFLPWLWLWLQPSPTGSLTDFPKSWYVPNYKDNPVSSQVSCTGCQGGVYNRVNCYPRRTKSSWQRTWTTVDEKQPPV